jgi:hypothetical protein
MSEGDMINDAYLEDSKNEEKMKLKKKLESEINQVYEHLDNLRKNHGISIKIAVGVRGIFCHQACLHLKEKYNEIGKEIFPGVTDDFENYENRHHPFFQMINLVIADNDREIQFDLQTLVLLPGETYEILQSGDNEVARIIRGSLIEYNISKTQVDSFAKKLGISSNTKLYADLCELIN